MKVELIDYTGAGHPDRWYAAKLLIYTKSTRLQQGPDTLAKIMALNPVQVEKELEAIALTIRSSWEFINYSWQITGVTRAYTHQQVRSRHGKYAQQAQRVVDMGEFEAFMPTQVQLDPEARHAWGKCMEAIGMTYRLLMKKKIPTQDCRGVLPTNVLTNIVVNFDLRNFADLCGKRENLRAQGEYADVVGP